MRSPPFPLSWRVWRSAEGWSPSTLKAERQAIAQAILDQQADYVLTVKGNQKRTLQAVATWLEEQAFAVPTSLKPVLDTFDERQGRLTRSLRVCAFGTNRAERARRMAWDTKHSGGGVDSDGQTAWSYYGRKAVFPVQFAI